MRGSVFRPGPADSSRNARGDLGELIAGRDKPAVAPGGRFPPLRATGRQLQSKLMRWYWIDRFIEFESGSYAKAVKNVTLAEEHLHDHFPGFAVMPASLMIEGMAQTGGILLGETHDFARIVILAKVPKMAFHGWVPLWCVHASSRSIRDTSG